MAESTPDDRAFICPHCDTAARAKVMGLAYWDGYLPDGHPVEPPTEWAMVQCERCSIPSVQIRQDYGIGFDEDEPVVVFPAPQKMSPSVPRPLREEWEEARKCFRAKAYGACVVMVRRTLEGTCADQSVSAKTLAKGLKTLKEQGRIDGMLAEWADALRVLGNQGAHFTGKQVSRDDAADSLAFAEALLDHLYVLRKRFEEFRARLDPT